MTSATFEAPPSDVGRKCLTVVLADESYGLALLKVREIVRTQTITTLPNLPDFVLGIIKLHDRVVPVVDLRVMCSDNALADSGAYIVIAGVTNSGRGELDIGLIVDNVEERVNLAGKHIAPPPRPGPIHQSTRFLGMNKVRERVKALLKIEETVFTAAIEGREAIT